MTVIAEGRNAFYMGARAHILEGDKEIAWAEKHVISNPAHSYIVGKFVEAERANSNGQFFQMEGLRMGQPNIAHSPMNLDHIPKKIVGAFVASDFIYPTQEDAAVTNPYIEALGVFWKAHFPQEWQLVQQAHEQGHLYFSMECVPEKVGCIGDNGCGKQFEYAGVQSPTYCDHINSRTADRDLINPHFTAGAVLLPPVKPGWSDANIHSLVAKHAEMAESIYAGVAEDMPHLGPREWEFLMGELLNLALGESQTRPS
jgi:hypothetical protein